MKVTVGLTCVNALSRWMSMTIHREGNIYEIKCANGAITQPTKKIGDTKKTGTTVSFLPGNKWLPEFDELGGFDSGLTEEMLKITAYLYPLLTMTFHDKKANQKKKTFHYDNGTVDFVKDYNSGKNLLPDILNISGSHKIKVGKNGDSEEIVVKGNIAMTWNETAKEEIYGYVNGLRVREGTHITGFKLAMATEIKKAIRERDLLKGKDAEMEITGDDTREGLICIISIDIPVPQFHGQTKDKLSNGEAQGAVQRLTGELIRETMDQSSGTAKIICLRAIAAARARNAADKARETTRKSGMKEINSLPTKLKDCISKNPEECELFITEGKLSCSH